jgi:hypothetical protein
MHMEISFSPRSFPRVRKPYPAIYASPSRGQMAAQL